MDEEREVKKSNIGSMNRAREHFLIRLVIVLFFLAMQIGLVVLIYGYAQKYIFYWRTSAFLLTAFIVLYIINKPDNPAYKLAWIIDVMAFPLVGGALYVMVAGNRTRINFVEEAKESHVDMFKYMPKNDGVQNEIHALSKSASVQSTYISRAVGFPAYKNTGVKYFPSGEENFECLIEELKKAKHYIFMEYFIIKSGKMWSDILDILIEKAQQGVDVRLIYDDFGCAMFMPSRFIKEMKGWGIKVVPFNPVGLFFNLRHNNRDHRKITVIDGHTGFTGGINLADEYINIDSKFGHWKDTGIMLKGDGVWNLTVMFLQTWRFLTKEDEDYSLYTPMKNKRTPVYTDGYIQPYGDTPVDEEIAGENIYLNMINKAKHYVYIMTPYLIIDNEMTTALTLAAKSGIDVRIITPGIPDKKMVYMVTQSYYHELIKNGVKIYQYAPGFVHAKTVVVDDSVATVGTINFDYRSLYLHFECGVWMFNTGCIFDIKEDFIKTQRLCEEVTLVELSKTSGLKKLWQSILRVFAPLL